MIKSKKSLLLVLVLVATLPGAIKFAIDGSLLQDLSQQARQSKTVDQYGNNPGAYKGSAARWTRAAFD